MKTWSNEEVRLIEPRLRNGQLEVFDFRPEDNGPEVRWCVTLAKALVEGKPAALVYIGTLAQVLWQGRIPIDRDYVLSGRVDLTVPLIAVTLPWLRTEVVLIDGWHRVAKALADGVDELPMHLLTPEAEARIRMAPSDQDVQYRIRHGRWPTRKAPTPLLGTEP
jgi:hypothetical protein